MRVIKFYAKEITKTEVVPYVWYIEDGLPPSKIIDRIESFLRQNELICYLSTFVLFDSAKEYDVHVNEELLKAKNKYFIC